MFTLISLKNWWNRVNNFLQSLIFQWKIKKSNDYCDQWFSTEKIYRIDRIICCDRDFFSEKLRNQLITYWYHWFSSQKLIKSSEFGIVFTDVLLNNWWMKSSELFLAFTDFLLKNGEINWWYRYHWSFAENLMKSTESSVVITDFSVKKFEKSTDYCVNWHLNEKWMKSSESFFTITVFFSLKIDEIGWSIDHLLRSLIFSENWLKQLNHVLCLLIFHWKIDYIDNNLFCSLIFHWLIDKVD